MKHSVCLWKSGVPKAKSSLVICSAGLVSIVNLSTSYRADVNVSYERDENLYVLLRERRLSGKMRNNLGWDGANDRHRSIKEIIKHAWSDSGKFGMSQRGGKISVGLNLGYFTGKREREI